MNSVSPIDILLVEDSPGDVRLVREALHEIALANRLHHVDDGEEAMAYLRLDPPYLEGSAPRPDLILLDLNLPRKGGHEVLRELKGDPRFRRIPIIVLTTSDADDDITRSYDLSANCFVTKPANLDEFLDVMHCVEDFWLKIARLPAHRAP
ncbi:response regulator [soil metagenome]